MQKHTGSIGGAQTKEREVSWETDTQDGAMGDHIGNCVFFGFETGLQIGFKDST